MPKLSTGREFSLLLPNFEAEWISYDLGVLGLMLARGVQCNKETLLGLVPIGKPDGLPVGLTVNDILSGACDWSLEEVSEFSNLLKNWPELDAMIASAVNSLPRLTAQIRDQHERGKAAAQRAVRKSSYNGGKHGYGLGFFDILGFEEKIGSTGRTGTLGLQGVESAYLKLTELVTKNNIESQELESTFKRMGQGGIAPLATRDNDYFLRYEIYGMYVSDSFCFWMDRNWPLSIHTAPALINDSPPNYLEWAAKPIPPDNFLEICNEAICEGIELGLPLRGAIVCGQAAIRPEKMIFLGEPIVDAARMEKAQQFIGAGFSVGYLKNSDISSRFLIPFKQHIKEGKEGQPHADAFRFSEYVLDWVLHWRATRSGCPIKALDQLEKNSNYSGQIYETTRNFIAASDSYALASPKTRFSKRLSDHYPYFNPASAFPTVAILDKSS